MSSVRMAVVVLTAVVMGTAGIVRALECEGRLVSMGASHWDVQALCGRWCAEEKSGARGAGTGSGRTCGISSTGHTVSA